MRYRLLACALIAVASLLVTSGTRTTAQTPPTQAPPTTPDQEALRQQFATFLGGMQDAVNTMKANPVTANALAATGTDPSGGLAGAQQQVPQLTSTDLAALQTAVSQNPNWQQIPAKLKSAVAAVPHTSAAPSVRFPNSALLTVLPSRPARQPSAQQSQFLAFVREFNGSPSSASTSPLAGLLNPFGVRTPAAALDSAGAFTDTCEDLGSAPDFGAAGYYVDAFALNEVQATIQAIMLATPGVFALPIVGIDVPTGVKIAEAVVWGVANVAYLVLSQIEAVALDCAVVYFFNMQASTLPTVPGGTDYTPASSEASVDALKTQASDMLGRITAVQGVVNTILHCQIEGAPSSPPPGGGSNCPPGLLKAADNLNATLSEDNINLSEVQNDTKDTQQQTYALNDTLCDRDTTKQCLSTSILFKARLAIVNLTTFQTLQVRMEIEANLSLTGNNPVGLFELPKSQGGFLETAHDIAKETIAKEQATGKSVFNALSYVSQGETAYAAKQYKTAYSFYAKAYSDATR